MLSQAHRMSLVVQPFAGADSSADSGIDGLGWASVARGLLGSMELTPGLVIVESLIRPGKN